MAMLGPAAAAAHRSNACNETLDELIAEAWAELSDHRSTECPVCGAGLAPVYGAHPRPVGGRCGSCATELG